MSVGPLNPDTINAPYWDNASPEADPLSSSYNPYRREYMTGVSVISHTMVSMPVKLDKPSEPYRVIGQTDLKADGTPVPGAPFPEGLIRRGPDWPFADMTPVCLEAA